MNNPPPSDQAAPGTAPRRQFADPAAWRALLSSPNAASFAQAWLTILCGQLDFTFGSVLGMETVVGGAFVALGDADSQRYTRTATYGEGEVSFMLAKAAERCLQLRRGIVQSGDAPGAPCQVAFPITLDEHLHGVVGFELAAEATPLLDSVMRFVQWGLGWFFRVIHKREAAEADGAARIIIDSLDLISGEGGMEAVAQALCTLLADRFDLTRVTLGTGSKGRMRPLGTSRGGLSPLRTDFVIAVSAAMEEAVDAGTRLLYPVPEEQSAALGAHQRLCRSHAADWAVTFPVGVPSIAGHEPSVALTFEGSGASPDSARLGEWETIAHSLGPSLAWRVSVERSLAAHAVEVAESEWHRLFVAPEKRRLWIVGLGVTVAMFLVFATGDYRVSAKATLEGVVKRAIVVPFDGYVAEATVHPGDRVKAGAPLARLDDRDLKLQKLDDGGRIVEIQHQIDEAMGQRDAANVNILTARRAQAEADLNLVNENLTRASLVAPFDAIVISGDPSQQIGAPMRRGEVLYELSPLDSFRVVVDVDEGDFADIQVGETGRLLLASLPYQTLPIKISRITPIATARDGKTSFRVDATLEASDAALRPGMEGVAKVSVGSRHYVWIWSHDLVNWVRLKLWEWIP